MPSNYVSSQSEGLLSISIASVSDVPSRHPSFFLQNLRISIRAERSTYPIRRVPVDCGIRHYPTQTKVHLLFSSTACLYCVTHRRWTNHSQLSLHFSPPTSKNNPYMQAASNPHILCLPRNLYPAFVERCSDLGSPSEWGSTMLPPRRSRVHKNTPVPVSAPRPLAVQIRFHTDPQLSSRPCVNAIGGSSTSRQATSSAPALLRGQQQDSVPLASKLAVDLALT